MWRSAPKQLYPLLSPLFAFSLFWGCVYGFVLFCFALFLFVSVGEVAVQYMKMVAYVQGIADSGMKVGSAHDGVRSMVIPWSQNWGLESMLFTRDG